VEKHRLKWKTLRKLAEAVKKKGEVCCFSGYTPNYSLFFCHIRHLWGPFFLFLCSSSCLVVCLSLCCIVMSCRVLSCLVLVFCLVSCLLSRCVSCLVFTCLSLSCLVLSCLVLSCLFLSYCVMSLSTPTPPSSCLLQGIPVSYFRASPVSFLPPPH